MKGKLDFLFLGVIGVMIGNTIIQSLLFQYQLGLNNYLGFVGWTEVLVIRILNKRPGRYGTALLLILGTLSLLNFTLGTIAMSFLSGHWALDLTL